MDIRNILILTQVKGIGPAFFKKKRDLLMHSNDYRIFLEEIEPEALDMVSMFEKEADSILQDCKSLGVKVISCLSEEYPSQLLEISDPPALLYLKGNTDLLRNVIAIIGTRHSTLLGNTIAERLGEYFSKDFSICNGLVEGIDEHSIYFNGKVTNKAIGIISGGMNYPVTCSKSHVKVIDDVLQAGGLVLSEFPPQQHEDKYSGSKASRIQAGLSHGLILVQSSLDGGSKYTLSTFVKLARTLGVIHFPSSNEYREESFGANRIIVSEKIAGIAKMIGLKTEKKICLKTIMPIQGKSDYEVFKNKVLLSLNLQTSLF